jgi:hypothetical protein
MYFIKFYISCILSFLFGMIGYKKGLNRVKKWIEH